MSNDAKEADEVITPNDDDTHDPADAFARAKPGAGEAGGAGAQQTTGSHRASGRRGGRRNRKDADGGGGAAAPKVEREPPPPSPDDEPMDPFDAAKVLVGMFDNMFGMVCAVRGYEKLAMRAPNGEVVPMLAMLAPKIEDKERVERALVRVMKHGGINVSPGMGLAMAAGMCWGAPIIALEIGRFSAAKQGEPKA